MANIRATFVVLLFLAVAQVFAGKLGISCRTKSMQNGQEMYPPGVAHDFADGSEFASRLVNDINRSGEFTAKVNQGTGRVLIINNKPYPEAGRTVTTNLNNRAKSMAISLMRGYQAEGKLLFSTVVLSLSCLICANSMCLFSHSASPAEPQACRGVPQGPEVRQEEEEVHCHVDGLMIHPV